MRANVGVTCTIQDIWNKFDRWAYHYQKVCHRLIELHFNSESFDSCNDLFLSQGNGLRQDIISDLDLTEAQLYNCISHRINFLRGYLVEISNDGAVFMAVHSNFLTLQYPSRCNHAMGIWLEQPMEGEIEAGSYYGFQEFDVSFFCKSIKDVDLASMRHVLPFDRMLVRQPKGKTWDSIHTNELLTQIKEDLEFDYSVTIHADGELGEILNIEFDWEYYPVLDSIQAGKGRYHK